MYLELLYQLLTNHYHQLVQTKQQTIFKNKCMHLNFAIAMVGRLGKFGKFGEPSVICKTK